MKVGVFCLTLLLPILGVGRIQPDSDNSFKAVKIGTERNYYIIYAVRDNLKYKIVSKKEKGDCVKIKKNQA